MYMVTFRHLLQGLRTSGPSVKKTQQKQLRSSVSPVDSPLICNTQSECCFLLQFLNSW